MKHGNTPADGLQIDRQNAFLLYTTFTGDVERTAHALNVRPVDVLRIADEEGWADKLKSIIELKKSTRPGDLERAINRAVNFTQAHRWRMLLEQQLSRMCAMTPEELDAYLMQETEKIQRDGTTVRTRKLSTRPLADMAAAIEKCHALTYQALADTASDRTRREENADSATAGGELHAALAAAMAKVAASTTPRALLFDAQLQIAETVAKPVPPES